MNEFLRLILFLPPQASTIARELDYLHYFVIITTMLGAGLVTLVGGYFLLRYKRRDHDPRYRPEAHGERRGEPHQAGQIPFVLELVVVFGLLSLFVLWWFLGYRQFVHVRVPPEDALEIYVTGKKWMWNFAYADGGPAGSAGNVVVPAGRSVKLIMTSRDVIHSFYVPDFRVKQDVIPGRYTTLWFEAMEPGVHEILCTEYCGTGHSTMRGAVVVLSAERYDEWRQGRAEVAVAGLPFEEPAVVGELAGEARSLPALGFHAAARHGCLGCHSVDGSPHIGPTWAGLYRSRIELEDGRTIVADEAYLTESMMDPAAKLHHGFEPVMPSYQGRLRPFESAAIVEYIKTLRDVPAGPHVPQYRLEGTGQAPR